MSEGILAQTIREAIRHWDAQKAAGATFWERVANLEKTLRASWPYTREWKYLCQTCGDYGLEMHEREHGCPGDATCGRPRPHLPHDFGTPCWCAAGGRFRAKAPTEADAVQAAARVTKPSRWGR